MTNFTEWIKAAGIRALKTFAQSLIACLPVTAATIGSVDWVTALSTAALAAVISLLMSVAGLPEVKASTEKAELQEENETLLSMLNGTFELKKEEDLKEDPYADILDK